MTRDFDRSPVSCDVGPGSGAPSIELGVRITWDSLTEHVDEPVLSTNDARGVKSVKERSTRSG